MFAVTILFLVLGAFLDTLLMLLIIVPMLMPTVIALGIDPVHFGVISVVNMMIGLVTPPMGELVFLIAGVIRHQGRRDHRETLAVPDRPDRAPLRPGLCSRNHPLAARYHGLQPVQRLNCRRAEGGPPMPAMKDLVKGTDRYRHFIGGAVGRFDRQGVDRGREPGHRRRHRLGAARQRRRCRPGGDGRPRGAAGLGGAAAGRARPAPARPRAAHPGEPRAAGATRDRRAGQAAARGARRDRGRGALPDLRRRGGAADHRRHHPLRQPRRADLDPARRPRRRRRADRLELPGRADVPQDRARR